MSRLTVYHQSTPDIPNKVLSHHEDIASTLAALGIEFKRAEASFPVPAGVGQEEVIATCRGEIDAWMAKGGYLDVDVISADEDHAQHIPWQAELLREHRLAGEWVLCVVAGRVQVSLHVGDYLYSVLCERDDRLVVPAGMAHWLDLGERPRIAAMRLFTDAYGWRPDYAKPSAHERFPSFEG